MESKYFSSTPINTGRQPELGFVKAFMIVLMLLNHACCELYNLEHVIVANVETSITFIGAGMFMICTGIGMCCSRHQSPSDFVKRGISLLTVG